MRNLKPDLFPAENDRQELDRISRSPTEPASRVQRTTIVLIYASGSGIMSITIS